MMYYAKSDVTMNEIDTFVRFYSVLMNVKLIKAIDSVDHIGFASSHFVLML